MPKGGATVGVGVAGRSSCLSARGDTKRRVTKKWVGNGMTEIKERLDRCGLLLMLLAAWDEFDGTKGRTEQTPMKDSRLRRTRQREWDHTTGRDVPDVLRALFERGPQGHGVTCSKSAK